MAGPTNPPLVLSPAYLAELVDLTIKIHPVEAELNASKTSGRAHRHLLKTIIAVLELRTSAPAPPPGVLWVTQPGEPIINNNSITETASEIQLIGGNKTVASSTITIPFAPATGRRTDAIVINYNATPAVYERIEGIDEHYLSPSTSPIIPADRLFVRYVIVTDGLVQPIGSTPVKSIEVDGQEFFPDTSGRLSVPSLGSSFTTITEDEFGTHPAFFNQHDVNAYLLSGGTYTPPTVQPITNATATPQSDTQILLTWTNPA